MGDSSASTSSLNMVKQTRWNVPTEMDDASCGLISSSNRSLNSFAARLVKVKASTDDARAPLSTKWATRLVSTRVFPVPGPATTLIGSVDASTAALCWSFNFRGGTLLTSLSSTSTGFSFLIESRIVCRWSRVFC